MINIVTYDTKYEAQHPGPVLFLAGPTTSRLLDGRKRVRDQRVDGLDADVYLSTWRADLITELHLCGFAGTVIVPEFRNHAVPFDVLAEQRWGNTLVPDGIPCKERSWGVIGWEIAQMEAADICVAWTDCRSEGAGIGLNARPEIQGLLERRIANDRIGKAGGWPAAFIGDNKFRSPRKLVLGISPECTSNTRFWHLAHQAGIHPARSLVQLRDLILFEIKAVFS